MILFLHSHHHTARWHIWRTRPLNALASWGNSYFSARLKTWRQLDVWEADKNKRRREKEEKGRKRKFQIWKRTEFYKLFEARYLIIHLMLQAAVRQYGNTLMHDNRFHCICIVKKKCVTTSGSGNSDVVLRVCVCVCVEESCFTDPEKHRRKF